MSAKDKEAVDNVDMNKSRSKSLSESLSSGTEDEEDLELKRIFAEEILDCEVLDILPPTPAPRERPPTRASSVLSMASSSAQSLSPVKRSRDKRGGSKKDRKMREKDICKALGFDMDDSELQDTDTEKEERVPMDNVLDDILMGKGKRKGKKYGAWTSKTFSQEEETLMSQYDKLRGKAPLKMTTEGRVAVLKEDVQTVRQTKDAVDALIAILERTKDRLINDDSSLVYTEPPLVVKTKKKRSHAGVKKPQSSS